MVAGKDAARPGEGKNSWLTGTAAWNWLTATQYILGIKPDYNGLLIDPCVPQSMKQYRVRRTFRGATFDITVKNPGGAQKGVKSLVVDGKAVSGNVVPFAPGAHTVEVTM